MPVYFVPDAQAPADTKPQKPSKKPTKPPVDFVPDKPVAPIAPPQPSVQGTMLDPKTSLPNQIGNAIGQAAQHVGNWVQHSDVGRVVSTPAVSGAVKAVSHPFTNAWNAVSNWDQKMGQAIENGLTQGRGYSAAGRQMGMSQGGADLMSNVLRGTLTPSSILAAPGVSEKALTVAGKVAQGTFQAARALGVAQPLAAATARTGALLAGGRLSGPAIRAAANAINKATEVSREWTNKYHGTPPELPQLIQNHKNTMRGVIHDTIYQQAHIHSITATPGERILMNSVLEGIAPPGALPQRLVPHYQNLQRMVNSTTTQALNSGVLDESIDNYLLHLYGPEMTKAIKAKSLIYPESVTDRAAQDALSGFQRAVQPQGFGPLQQLAVNQQRGVLAQRYADIAASGGGATARGSRIGQFEREYRASNVPTPEEGTRGIYGRQVLPTGSLRSVGTSMNRHRVFTSIPDAKAVAESSGVPFDGIEDPAVLIPMKTLQVGIAAANRQLYRDVVNLGSPWVVPPRVADMGRGYVPISSLMGSGGASVAADEGWESLYVHPRVADVIRSIHGQYGSGFMDSITKILNWPQERLKRIIFLTPAVHGANQVRAAWLGSSWKILNPKYWQKSLELSGDAREYGPITREFLASGGSMSSGSTSKEIGKTIDSVMHNPESRTVLQNSGTWQEELTGAGRRAAASAKESIRRGDTLNIPGVGKAHAYVHALNDEILWNVVDSGGRLHSYLEAKDQLARAVQRGQMTQGDMKIAAARYANLVWNDYSHENYGKLEQALASMMFVYSWTRGRAQLFAALGRSYLPGGNAAEKALYQRMATRWAMANVVMPHIWRAWHDKQAAGLQAASIPAATITDPTTGRQTHLYVRPTGWYDDAFQMLSNPLGFALARSNPSFRIAATAYQALNQAAINHQNASDPAVWYNAISGALPNVYPAGTTQLLRPGPVPLPLRIAPIAGIPVTSVPPPMEDPKVLFQQKMDDGDWYAAGVAAVPAGEAYFSNLYRVPREGRSDFKRGYNYAKRLRLSGGVTDLSNRNQP